MVKKIIKQLKNALEKTLNEKFEDAPLSNLTDHIPPQVRYEICRLFSEIIVYNTKKYGKINLELMAYFIYIILIIGKSRTKENSSDFMINISTGINILMNSLKSIENKIDITDQENMISKIQEFIVTINNIIINMLNYISNIEKSENEELLILNEINNLFTIMTSPSDESSKSLLTKYIMLGSGGQLKKLNV